MDNFKIEDFKSLPANVDLDNTEEEKATWTFGMGGHGTPEGSWHISKLEEREGLLFETIYLLPRCISQMMQLQKKWAAEETTDSIKRILKIS